MRPPGGGATAGDSAPLIEVNGIRKGFGGPNGTQVLDGVSFAARKGEFVSVVGPSGCGKTTLLLTLTGLITPDEGQVTFQSRPVAGETPPGMAIVFQDYSRSLFPWKRNIDNVVFGMRRVEGMNRADKIEHSRSLLDAVGLTGFERHFPWQLSGGMQQRVAIARALASQSTMLALDEPLASVDAQTRADMQDLLLGIARRYGQTCVLVTHDVDEAVYMADSVVVMTSRPTRVARRIDVPLPKPRDQIETREDPTYLAIRHEVVGMIRSMRRAQAAEVPAEAGGEP